MAYEFLSIRRDGPIEYLMLNRPDVRNALNDRVIAELTDWTSHAAGYRGPGAVRVVVIGGAGQVFCSGADAAWMSQTVAYSEADNLRDAMLIANLFRSLDELPVPLVGRIHGAAFGGGAGLAAVCDIVVADQDT